MKQSANFKIIMILIFVTGFANISNAAASQLIRCCAKSDKLNSCVDVKNNLQDSETALKSESSSSCQMNDSHIQKCEEADQKLTNNLGNSSKTISLQASSFLLADIGVELEYTAKCLKSLSVYQTTTGISGSMSLTDSCQSNIGFEIPKSELKPSLKVQCQIIK